MTINKTKDDTERGATARDLQVLPVDGSELTYEVRGEGPPVLLIHGIAGRIEVWSDIQEALATTHRVIAHDLRGHGRSPNPPPDVRVHAKDAAALIEHAAGEPAIVAGWSSGANVTLQLVDDQPELVKAAVLVESGFHMTRHPVANADVIRTLLGVWRHWLRAATERPPRGGSASSFPVGAAGAAGTNSTNPCVRCSWATKPACGGSSRRRPTRPTATSRTSRRERPQPGRCR